MYPRPPVPPPQPTLARGSPSVAPTGQDGAGAAQGEETAVNSEPRGFLEPGRWGRLNCSETRKIRGSGSSGDRPPSGPTRRPPSTCLPPALTTAFALRWRQPLMGLAL
ncbi:unnamed protein product [Rangifer tarandus platyrhynchus]|uniref:Uncharacterized protein n=1 Tax=Rangifer tarandus platyrhynchus TaxID=3082113 RepID=A0AC59YC19_RANTA